MVLHFLSREKKTKQKKTPVSRLTLRFVQPADEAAGARGNSPAFAWPAAGSDSPRAFSRPPRQCSARDKGKAKPKDQKPFLSPLKGTI